MAALYRRYRPETFQEVIGQAHVTDPLRHALVAERTHHAYLFSGPRGCGKTTSARILARCLNCAKGPTDTPCGECPSCVELSRDGGGSLDVVEIDAASHNGVDDARELRERAIFAPARDRYKIYILDEAHMVTQQGFNALLKIVEEPPEHVKFIFATTEPDKVLTTIRSRTHHYPFRLVPPAELLSYLESVAESEGVTIDEGVLSLVVRSGGGSVRDSLSLLDQLMAGSIGDTITVESAQSLLGYTPRVLLDEIISALATHDAPGAYRALDSVMQSGQDPRRFVEDLLAHVRDIIVIQATGVGATDLFPGVSQGDLAMWNEQASWFSPDSLASIGEAISDALQHMSGVTAPRLQLELMLAKLLTRNHTPASTPAPTVSGTLPATTATATTTHPGKPVTTAPMTSSTQESPTDEPAVAKQSVPVDSDSAAEPRLAEAGAGGPDGAGADQSAEDPVVEAEVQELADWSVEGLGDLWPAIVEAVGEQKKSLWVVLSETKPMAVDGDVVTIGFARRGDADVLKKPQGPGSPLPNADILRDAIYQHTGHRVRFTIGQLEQSDTPVPAAEGESQWPVVAKAGSEAHDVDAEPTDGKQADSVDSETKTSATDHVPPGPQLASRGEPVIRQVLGGELIGEEILEEMSGQGEADV